MKSLLTPILLIFLFASNILFATGNNTPFEIKPGTKLIYGVEAGFNKYDFIVEITSVENGIAINWSMTAPINSRGKINLLPEALSNAVVYHNFFKDATELTLSDKSSVFLSAKNAEDLNTEKASASVTQMDLGDGFKFYKVDQRGASIAHIDIDNKHLHLPLTIAYSDENNYEVNFLKVGNYYLIGAMHTSFSIVLKEVLTK